DFPVVVCVIAAGFGAASCALLRPSSDRQHRGCPLFKTGFRPGSRHLRSRPSSTGRRRGAHMEGLCSAPCLVSSVTTTLTTANRGVTCKRDAKNPTLMAGHGLQTSQGAWSV